MASRTPEIIKEDDHSPVAEQRKYRWSNNNYLKAVILILVVAAIASIVALLDFNNTIQPPQQQYSFVKAWGSSASPADGQFRYLTDVAVDSGGNVYVADSSNHRIQKFDSNGNFLTKWGTKG
jgi:outer membrane protein assembly factor BamB